MMNLRWIETFRRVVELQSFTRAAESLGMSQPAVSQQVRSLEHYFDEQLVTTAARGVRITEAGQKVYQLAVRVEGDIRRVRQELAEGAHGPEGLVRIACGPTALCHYIPQLLKRLWIEHPRISIRTATLVARPMTDAVINGTADVAIQSGMYLDPRLVATPCMDDHVVLVCAPEHPLARLATVAPADLTGMKIGLISPLSETGRLAAEWIETQNLIGVERVELGATEAVRAAALAGLLAGFVSHYAVAEDIQAGRLLQVRIAGPAAVRRMYALHQPTPSEVVDRLLRVIAEMHRLPAFSGQPSTG